MRQRSRTSRLKNERQRGHQFRTSSSNHEGELTDPELGPIVHVIVDDSRKESAKLAGRRGQSMGGSPNRDRVDLSGDEEGGAAARCIRSQTDTRRCLTHFGPNCWKNEERKKIVWKPWMWAL